MSFRDPDIAARYARFDGGGAQCTSSVEQAQAVLGKNRLKEYHFKVCPKTCLQPKYERGLQEKHDRIFL